MVKCKICKKEIVIKSRRGKLRSLCSEECRKENKRRYNKKYKRENLKTETEYHRRYMKTHKNYYKERAKKLKLYYIKTKDGKCDYVAMINV